MENASKALIIAGAILLSILIIGLGMFIYNQAAGAMSGANLDPQKVSAYNSQFEQYEGTQSGTNVRALYNLIRSHNNANIDDVTLQVEMKISDSDYTETSYVDVSGRDQKNGVSIGSNVYKAGSTYFVSFAVDKNSGYIASCNVRQLKAGEKAPEGNT